MNPELHPNQNNNFRRLRVLTAAILYINTQNESGMDVFICVYIQ